MRRLKNNRLLPLVMFLVSTTVIGTVEASDSERVQIVTSTTDLASLAQEVGADRVNVTSLALGYQDPHYVPETARALLKLSHADLIILVGLQLENARLGEGLGATSPLVQSKNPRIQFGSAGYFDTSPYVQVVEIPDLITRAQGNHPLGNAHYWLDPENGRRIARAIAAKLSAMSPDNQSYFQQRFAYFDRRLAAKEQTWEMEMRPYRGFKVVSYHRTWSNFLKHFDLVSVGEIEPLPGIPPEESHTHALIREMLRQHVRVILVEPPYKLITPRRIADKTGAKVLVLPGSVRGAPHIEDYVSLIDYNVTNLIKAFQ